MVVEAREFRRYLATTSRILSKGVGEDTNRVMHFCGHNIKLWIVSCLHVF
jgi:hypothetical protein